MVQNYIELILVKVTKRGGQPEYFAVCEKTLENMENASSAMQYIVGKDAEDYNSKQFGVEELGPVQVEIP